MSDSKLLFIIKRVILNNIKILFKHNNFKIYRQGECKSSLRRIYELYIWLLRDRSFNEMYYAFGLNLKGTDQGNYIGKREFLKIKNKAEDGLKIKFGGREFDHRIITKDKFYATSIMAGNRIPCIENSGILVAGRLIREGNQIYEIEEILNNKSPFILKNAIIEASKGVYFAKVLVDKILIENIEYNLTQFTDFLAGSKWIIQDVHKPIKKIQEVNDSALNTTRIMTANNGDDIVYLTGFQSFATNNQSTDSWDKGTIYVGIDIRNECLLKDGFYHPTVGNYGIVQKHPDSGIEFEGYKIKYLKDAVDLCIRAHYLFLHLFCIGWDVALTDDGPKIVEANEVPGLNAVQCIEGGLRKTLIKLSKTL